MKVLHSDRKKSASCQKILISLTLSHMECKILIFVFLFCRVDCIR
jgi:hypothetical protein